MAQSRRPGRAQAGREEPREKPAASRHEPAYTRTGVAFGCATAGYAAPCRARRMKTTTLVAPATTKSRSVHATVTPTTGMITESPLVEVRTPDWYSARTIESKYAKAAKKTPGTDSTAPTTTASRRPQAAGPHPVSERLPGDDQVMQLAEFLGRQRGPEVGVQGSDQPLKSTILLSRLSRLVTVAWTIFFPPPRMAAAGKTTHSVGATYPGWECSEP